MEVDAEKSPVIRPINKGVFHRIAGQVILDLSSAVKELVENSLDAGATNVEIAQKEYGLESFQVIDNGSGVSPQNFEKAECSYDDDANVLLARTENKKNRASEVEKSQVRVLDDDSVPMPSVGANSKIMPHELSDAPTPLRLSDTSTDAPVLCSGSKVCFPVQFYRFESKEEKEAVKTQVFQSCIWK